MLINRKQLLPLPEPGERESFSRLPACGRPDYSYLIVPAIIVAAFVIGVLSVLFCIYALTHLAKLPSMAEQAVASVQQGLAWLGGMIVIVMWLFVLKQAAGVGKAIAEMVKAWIAAISEIPKRHLWGMNTTHVVTDGRVPVRIESVRERSEHFHYGGSRHRDEEEEESGDPEPVPRSSQILEHLMIGNRRNGSSNGHTP